MKMPAIIDNSMFAPCGINCTVCYKHCISKKMCLGCFSDNATKPEHCKKCRIKNCVIERGFTYCFECGDFPCKLNKNLDRSYKRYNWSLIMNSEEAKSDGVAAFLERDRKHWTCDRCGGVISIHDAECSDCRTKLEDIRMGPYAHFGIIDCLDRQKDYSVFNDGLNFKDCLEKYHCVAIPDDVINDWWDGLTLMKSYYHQFDRPDTALARWGVTLIPPDSLDLFIEIIVARTSKRFSELCKTEIADLLNLLARAKSEARFVIHYGV